jgi:hypothetical protein
MIAGTGAGHIEQMSLGLVDFLKIGIVGNILDPLLRGNDLVVACHNGDGSEFQSLRQVHGADRETARWDSDLLAQFNGRHASPFHGSPGSAKLARRADEYADLMGRHALCYSAGNPFDRIISLKYELDPADPTPLPVDPA